MNNQDKGKGEKTGWVTIVKNNNEQIVKFSYKNVKSRKERIDIELARIKDTDQNIFIIYLPKIK